MNQIQLPKLYQYAVCPFCCKVKAILSYKKIPYQTIEVHPLNKKEISFSKEYRKVPIFISSDGQQINDSTPIMRYIDEKYPDKPVFEKDETAKENEEKWLKWADEVLVRALPPLIYRSLGEALQAFDYITKEGNFSWIQQRFVKYSGALVMKMVAKKSTKSQGISDPEAHLKQCLNKWKDALKAQEFLGGKKPNGADLAVFGILKSIDEMPAFIHIRENNSVYAWFQRMQNLTEGLASKAA